MSQFFGSNSGVSYGQALPYTKTIDPGQLGMYLRLDQAEMLRIQRYGESNRFYFGRHWLFKREDGEPLVTINYFRKIIDKSVSFLVGKGFVNRTPESLEDITKPFLDEVWKYNKKHQFAYDAATMGALTGDVFVMPTFEDVSPLQRSINPFSQGRIRLNLLGSEQCFPTWDPLNVDTLLQFRIETIYYSDRPEQDVDSGGSYDGRQLHAKRFTQIITPTRITEQMHGDQPVYKPNALGEIPIVHIKNMSIPREYYGLPDAQDLVDLQRELNEKSTDISDIINYHSAPITVITGAKAKQLERGPRQIWSGLPADAQVHNLEMGGDLNAANSYWDKIKKALFELSDIPEGALGTMQPISNTSGVALHLQYQPLLEKTDKKKVQYEPGFEQINYFILRIGTTMGLLNLPFDLCSECGGRIVEVPSGKNNYVWDASMPNPATGSSGYFREVPQMKKQCFHIDKETLDFMDPEEMRLKFWRQYGFGNQLREMRLKDIETSIKNHKGSYWDYTLVQKALLDKWKSTELSKEQKDAHKVVAGRNAFPQETAVLDQQQQGEYQTDITNATQELPDSGDGQPAAPQQVPSPSPAEPHPTPPPELQVIQLPPDDIDIPEEPVHITMMQTYLHPETGQVVMQVPKDMFLVPTDCRKPKYLNPFETTVHFLDVLPKDEALQAQLYETYQNNNWVDEKWVRGKIPEIARDQVAIEKRIKDRDAAAQRLDAAQKVIGPGGAETTTYMEGAPPMPSQAQVPGQGGNPTPMNQQLGGT